MVDTSGMRSGLENCTPVCGFVFPSPPTPPSNAFDVVAYVVVAITVDKRSLLNCFLVDDVEISVASSTPYL